MQLVYPQKQDNESIFLKVAKELDSELLFLYPFSSSLYTQLMKEDNQKNYGFMLSEKDIVKTKSLKGFFVIPNPENMRMVVEQKYISLVFDIEQDAQHDQFHSRLSGLNQVLAKLMAKNGITYGISLSLLQKDTQRERTLGRIKQNIRICNKYKIKILLSSFAREPFELRNEKDLKAYKELVKRSQKASLEDFEEFFSKVEEKIQQFEMPPL